MKKILALVLAMMMVLCAVSALAAGSKTNPDINQADTDDEEIGITKAEDNEGTQAIKDAIKEAAENGSAIDGLPDEVKDQLPQKMIENGEKPWAETRAAKGNGLWEASTRSWRK